MTGGAGFIGSHLCEALLKRGHDVICLDNFFSGVKRNIVPLLDRKNFELIRHDIIVPILLEVDRIYHLACPAAPIHYQKNPVKTVKVNVMGTLNMLGLAKRVKARILLTSTSEVYGDPQEHPQKETYWGHVNPVGPRSCYDEGKRVAETLMTGYHLQNGVDIRIARIFNTYGTRMLPDDGRVVPNFILQALRNEPITVYGDGAQTRSFCFVGDMVDGLINLMEAEGEEEIYEPMNLGNPAETSILDLAREIVRLAGSTSGIVHEDLPQDDPVRRCPDIGKAKRLLGWSPEVSLEEGLKQCIEWWQKEM